MDEKCIIDPERDCIGKAEAAKLEGLAVPELLDVSSCTMVSRRKSLPVP